MTFKKRYLQISKKYLEVLLACNTLKLLAKWNSSKWGFIINIDYCTQRRIIDRQKRGILTSSNELCGAHYRNLWSLTLCEDFLKCQAQRANRLRHGFFGIIVAKHLILNLSDAIYFLAIACALQTTGHP